MIYVSTDGQSLDAQVIQHRRRRPGVPRSDERRQKPTQVDRLADATRDLRNTLAVIAGKEAGFCSLDDARADTGEGRKRSKARRRQARLQPEFTAHRQGEAIRRRVELGEPVHDIARCYHRSHSTISRLIA